MQLSFSQNKIIDRFNFHELPEINQVQFLIAGRNAWGSAKSFLLDIFSAGDTGEQMVWEYFKITDTVSGLYLYDAWILADDSGTVFIANSSVSAGVEMCQSYFDAVSSSEDAAALAENIYHAYKHTAKAFENKDGGYNSAAFISYWDDFYNKRKLSYVDEGYWKELTKKLELKIAV